MALREVLKFAGSAIVKLLPVSTLRIVVGKETVSKILSILVPVS
jgi:hypothetical protein